MESVRSEGFFGVEDFKEFGLRFFGILRGSGVWGFEGLGSNCYTNRSGIGRS